MVVEEEGIREGGDGEKVRGRIAKSRGRAPDVLERGEEHRQSKAGHTVRRRRVQIEEHCAHQRVHLERHLLRFFKDITKGLFCFFSARKLSCLWLVCLWIKRDGLFDPVEKREKVLSRTIFPSAHELCNHLSGLLSETALTGFAAVGEEDKEHVQLESSGRLRGLSCNTKKLQSHQSQRLVLVEKSALDQLLHLRVLSDALDEVFCFIRRLVQLLVSLSFLDALLLVFLKDLVSFLAFFLIRVSFVF